MKTIQELRDAITASASAIDALKANATGDERELTDSEMGLIDSHLEAAETAQTELKAAEEREATINAQAARLGALTAGLGESTGRLATPEAPKIDATIIEGVRDLEAERPFANLGEQMLAVYRAEQPSIVHTKGIDKRLLRLSAIELSAAASGMNTVIDSEGGFPIQTDFIGMILDSAAETGEILSRVDRKEVGPQSNSAKWMQIDESSVADTVFGGVQVLWEAEADAATASKPVLKKAELVLHKLFGLAYATSEQLEDTTFTTGLFNDAFSTAIDRKLEGDIISGSGTGRPLGILNGAGTVSIAKESGQAAASILYENIVKMWTRQKKKTNSVWLVHPDLAEVLAFMEFPIGTGGVPVFLPPGGASVSAFSVLYGRPLIETDQCSAVGTVGDIILADLNDYLVITKGGVRSESSMHVRFLNDEQTFRFIFRANGQPKNNQALTIKNSSKTRSTFVTLATRA